MLAELIQTGLYILSSIMGLLENHVAVRMATLQDLTTSNEPLSPPRIQKWNTAVHPVISNGPRSARAIAIGIGDEESVAKLQPQMDTHHMLALREIANLVRCPTILRGKS